MNAPKSKLTIASASSSGTVNVILYLSTFYFYEVLFEIFLLLTVRQEILAYILINAAKYSNYQQNGLNVEALRN